MINFLEEKYGAKVTCNQVCQDGYEVSNLITRTSTSFFSQSRGFLVEHFIKPPVEITFIFPHQIQVSYVELGLCVGAQTTDGVEILVADNQNVHGVLRGVFHRCPISERQLKISNVSFRGRPPFQEHNGGSESASNNSKHVFKFNHLMNHVQIIRLRLTKTLGSSVPALGSVKVVGIPARTCGPEELKRVLQLYKSNSEGPNEDPDIQILPLDSSKLDSGPGKKDKGINIPEEFLDALTFEVMTVPVLLPSGQSVDRSTLEKSTSSQSSWGRIPYDPFTGIPFGPGRQPVANASLKARIDAFLIKNAHLDPYLARVPRSLGEKPKELDICKTPSLSGPSQETCTNVNKNIQLRNFVESTCNSATPNTSHEQNLKDSLDAALKLYCRNTSTQFKKLNHAKKIAGCVGCSTSGCGPQYKLPCGHTLCRKCLLSAQNHCVYCKQHYQRDQVCRTYNIP